MANSNIKTFFGEKIDMFWWPRESGSKGYRCVNGDRGNAMGAYQFDRRYALVPFMKYCVDYNAERYSKFNKFIAYGAGSPSLQNNQELANTWLEFCDNYEEEFANLQDEYAYKYYYVTAKEYAVKHGVPIDKFTTVLKGSLWSFAIRSGTESGAKKIVNAYSNNKTEMKLLRVAYATYGNADANRWNPSDPNSQFADANRIYNEQYGEKKNEEVVADMYRVGTDWKDGKCINQKGAYTSKDNAIKQCKSLGSPYKVFDAKGVVVYSITEVQPSTPVAKPVEEPKKEEPVNENKTYPDKTNEYKVCTGWANGHSVGQKGAFSNYENAKKEATRLATAYKTPYYVYNSKGSRLFLCNPNISNPDVVNGYKVGTGVDGERVINQAGAFTSFQNAKNYADKITQEKGTSYRVYLNGKLKYTAAVK